MGFCMNCDNRHGCRSKTPPCIELMRKDGAKGIRGKDYIVKVNRTDICEKCEFSSTCSSFSARASC